MRDKIITTFAILCALCVVVASLGGVAIWDIYKNLSVRSSIQGEVISESSIPDRETVYDFDDSTLYFSYTLQNVDWLHDASVDRYYSEYLFAAMNYDSATRRYAVFMNEIEGRGTNYYSALESRVDLIFTSPHGDTETLSIFIKFAFYTNKTIMRIEVPGAQYDEIGYFNTLLSAGVTIDIYESTSIATLPPIAELPTVDFGLTFDTPLTNVIIDLTECQGTSVMILPVTDNLYFPWSEQSYASSSFYISSAQIDGHKNEGKYNYFDLLGLQSRTDFVNNAFYGASLAGKYPTIGFNGPAATRYVLETGQTHVLQLDYFTPYLFWFLTTGANGSSYTYYVGSSTTAVMTYQWNNTFKFSNALMLSPDNLGLENAGSKITQNTVHLKIKVEV